MGKKLVMAQKRGETRALCLGVAMVACAAITYYILATTVLPLYQKSVWTQESTCRLIESSIRDQEELEGRKCSYIPGSLDNYQAARADVEKVRANFHEHQVFYCFSATQENETSVLYRRLYGPQALLFSLFWPTFLLTGGLLLIAMVKLNQSLSILAAQK
ncbi:calcium-activated potassium channel subunit beta-1 isoform X2 [Choloepus didactylus]|uniref:calcium-activated potassium channel subunit beta-1 isoform X2 n=1 Tax=Choloepus didactylus TaxID=27675 RepID=UPI00189DCC35|nr:calcium-activated potassium channel subunit beta-1 isoform X2 [Choloepus didactylus]